MICQSMKEKQPTPKVYYPRIPLDTRLMARVSMDIKEMPKSILRYTCILLCLCEYTNWVKTIPLVDKKSGTITDAILLNERLASIWQESSECKERKENNKSLSLRNFI